MAIQLFACEKKRFSPEYNYISGTLTDGVEIPTPNSGFSKTTSSIKDYPNDCDNDRLPKIAKLTPKTSILPFPVVGPCRNHFALSVVENPRFAVRILILPVVVPEICISGFGATVPFPVVGHLTTLYSGLPWSKIPDLPLEFRCYLL